MVKKLTRRDRERINAVITDRSNVFYWQTDRQITPEEAGLIWSDRHKYFTDNNIIHIVNRYWKDDQLVSLDPLDTESSLNLGNVNSVRVAHTKKKQDVILRLHPKGIKNGYFFVEACAASRSQENGLPSYRTFFIHTCNHDNDFAFHICEKLPGIAMKKWLEAHPDNEEHFVREVGIMMANLHKIPVSGFGPFINDRAEKNTLQGIHKTERDAILAGLDFNVNVLIKERIFHEGQMSKICKLFRQSPLLNCSKPVLVHNDFADWNLLTDGKRITGICDWDECVGGDAIADIACWSTFFSPERLSTFLDGYFSTASKSHDFNEKFELLRFRYTISKMTLRIRRYLWEPSETIREKIEIGKKHLALSLKYFNIN